MPEPIPVTQAEEPEQQAIPVEKTAGSPPPPPIKVTRAQVAAAKLRLKLDKDRGLPPDPAWEAVASAQLAEAVPQSASGPTDDKGAAVMNVLTKDITGRVDLLDAKVDQLQERVSTLERLEQPPNEQPRRHSADLEAIWNSPTYFASDIIDLAEVAEVVRRLWIRQQTSQERLSQEEQVTLDAACRALSALAQLARPEDLSDAETPASVRKDE